MRKGAFLQSKTEEDARIREQMVPVLAKEVAIYARQLTAKYSDAITLANEQGQSSEAAAIGIVQNMNGQIHVFKQKMRAIIQAVTGLFYDRGHLIEAPEYIEYMGTIDETKDYARTRLLMEINNWVVPVDFLGEVTARVAREIWSILDDVEYIIPCDVPDDADP